MEARESTTRPARLPVLFVGHGSPMNAVDDNPWSRGFGALAGLFPRPSAVLSVSAHWYPAGTFLTASERPETVHDFGGFPEELYLVEYPAPGDPALARRVSGLLGEGRASLAEGWGLDHGTWSVLRRVFPSADVPVVQLSIDSRLLPAEHLALGRALAPLREEGVLVMGSGNLVHNLRAAATAARQGDTATPPWASAFDADVARALEQRDEDFLVRALGTEAGRRSHPTPEHYLPLLYAVGASGADDPVRFPIVGFDMGSLSMRAALMG